ncbi:asparagine synthase-related protein [Dyadobacter diqingensis]|uniref:asparagine synthase-related protein n=1 Tax=Dyadobacter diqingensis TaxID=2938121 RepID=UPI0020C1A0F5|nr:asparagine synthase-related protein [Dyadobacter diqingensis]
MIADGFIYFNDAFASYNKELGKNVDSLVFSNGFISVEETVAGESEYRPYLICGRTELGKVISLKSDYIDDFSSFYAKVSDAEKGRYSLSVFYDEKDRQVSLVRDAFGVVPLYYHHLPGKFLAFSTDLNSLISICGRYYVPEVNSGHVAKFLTFSEANGTVTQETFYSGINTVACGHITTFTCDNSFTEPYLKLNPNRWTYLSTVTEYGKVFQDLFKKSVEMAVTGFDVVGSHLSGGLDSSSIICEVRHLGAEKEIHSFYVETKTRLANEGKYVDKVVEHIGCCHHEIQPSESDLDKLILHTSIYGHPECMILSSAKHNSILEAAINTKSKILLIGHDGDSIIGHGIDEYLGELLAEEKWDLLSEAMRERSGLVSLKYLYTNWESFSADKKYSIFIRNYFYKVLAGKFHVLTGFDFIIYLNKICKNLDIPVGYFVQRGFKTLLGKLFFRNKVPNSILNKECDLSNGNYKIPDLATSLRGTLSHQYQFNFEDVYSKPAIEISEQYYALGNYYGISLRFPFYDRHLYEFSMSVPMSVKFGKGYGRGHLREGMRDVLPEEIRLRTNKANFILYSRLATLRLLSQGEAYLEDSCLVWKYVDKRKFRLSCELLANNNQSNEVYTRAGFYVFRTIALSVWLDKF